MRTRLPAATVAIATAILLAGCSSGTSYASKTDHCAEALAKRTPGDKSKPAACEGIKPDDYDLLNGDAIMKSMGVVDGNGHVNLDKLIDPTDTP